MRVLAVSTSAYDGNRRSGILGTQVESNTRAAEITVVVTWL